MMSVFSRPKRPYKGQVSDLLAFAQFFFWKFFEVYSKVARIWSKFFLRKYPRPATIKTTFRFGIKFLWSYPSELNQNQIMWLFWPKIDFQSKILAFKGQESPSIFFQPNSAKISLQSTLFWRIWIFLIFVWFSWLKWNLTNQEKVIVHLHWLVKTIQWFLLLSLTQCHFFQHFYFHSLIFRTSKFRTLNFQAL